jgi:poly-beta-1,6-N-acetyl-D-glucosamine N-deacetylase
VKLLDRHREAQEQAAITRSHGAALMPELGPAAQRGHVGHRLSAVGLRLLALGVVLSLVAAAVVLWWWKTYLGFQEGTAAPAFGAADSQEYADWAAQNAARIGSGYGAAPIVLTYHDISPDPDAGHYVISPEAFASQMKMLRESGYRTLTGSQYTDYLQGTFTPPEQSVVITFDDGTSGLYKYADAILDDNGFTAVSFLITASVGTKRPYYLTWQQIDRMQSSGRWSFQSHTDSLHYRTDVDGQQLPAMAALESRDGVVETGEQFADRMRQDIAAADTHFDDHGLPAPTLFSYPFSAPSSRVSNDAVEISSQVFADHYVAAFTNHGHPIAPAPVSAPQTMPLERLEVTRGETTREVFERLRAAQTLPVAPMDPVAVDNSWQEPGRYLRGPIHDSELPSGTVRFEADTLTYAEALWAAQRTDQWTDYTLTATAIDLRQGSSVGLRVRTGTGSDQSVRLMVSRERATVTDSADRVVASSVLTTSGTHEVHVTVSPELTTILVDGSPIATVPSRDGRGGFSVIGSRNTTAQPFAAWTDLRISPV